ncbi:metallophosphoesterase [Nanoarchaeota archaeon]
MKILAFTDSHGNTKVLRDMKQRIVKENIKVVICAGDFTIFQENMKYILKKISEFKIPVLLVHGNHEDAPDVKHECEKYSNLIFLHEKSYKINNTLILGYGGGGFSLTGAKFKKVSKSFLKKIEKEKKNNKHLKIVLFTHGPAYRTELDIIMEEHCGSKSIRDFIKQVKPELHICGHLHENEGIKDKIGSTLTVNPGPYGEIFEV